MFELVKARGLKEALAELEKSLLLQALEESGWNITKAGRLIGIKRTTMIEKMKRNGIVKPGCPHP